MARRSLGGYFRRCNLLTSLILVFPLWLIYQLGVVFMPQQGNGADFLTERLVLLAGSLKAYLLGHLVLALLFAVVVLILRRKQQFDPRIVVPLILESSVYAITMGGLIVSLMNLLHISPELRLNALHRGPLSIAFVSIGAGVNEELLFRLILLSATLLFLQKFFSFSRWATVALGFLITAALFSAAHHLIGGEPWHFGVFTYRLFCGLIFAALYQWRGFAVAVYTHTLYDVYVMVLKS